MTVLTAGSGPVYMLDPIDLVGLLDSFSSGTPNSTSFSFSNDTYQEVWTFQGTGFGGYDGGLPTTGTVTGIAFSIAGGNIITISGGAVPIATLIGDLASGDPTALLFDFFSGADQITGSGMDDLILSLDGADNVTGNGGNDYIDGGLGNDTLAGGAGDDTVFGGGGVDSMDGGAGFDAFGYLDTETAASLSFTTSSFIGAGPKVFNGSTVSGFEAFYIEVGSGDDTVTVDTPLVGHNAFYGGAGADRFVANLSASATAVTMALSLEQVVLTSGAANVTLDGVERYAITSGSGNDALLGGSGDDSLSSGLGNDTLNGGAGANTLLGGDGADTITSGGADSVDGGDGDDAIGTVGATGIDGGAGSDFANVNRIALSAAAVFSSADLASATGVTFTDGGYIRNIERFQIALGAGDDVFTLNTALIGAGYSFDAGAGFNTFNADLSAETAPVILINGLSTATGSIALAGFDLLNVAGGSGNDTLQTGNGAAGRFTGGAGADSLTGGAAADLLSGGSGDDTLSTAGALDTVDGGDGSDSLTLAYTGSASTTFSATAMASDAGNEWLAGSIIRNVEHFEITGGSGSDQLTINTIHSGTDKFLAGDGEDTLIADLSGMTDAVTVFVTDIGSGNITIAAGGSFFFTGVEHVLLSLTGAADNITDSAMSDFIDGRGGNDVIVGGDGVDTLRGGEGNDELRGGRQITSPPVPDLTPDALYGDAGDDLLVGGAGDTLDGGAGADRIQLDLTGSTTGVVFSLAQMASAEGLVCLDGTTVRNVENVNITGGSGDDTLIVSAVPTGNVQFYGGGGVDRVVVDVSAFTGRTIVEPGVLYAETPYFAWSIGLGGDVEQMVVTTGSGDDALRGSAGAEEFHSGAGNDDFFGTLGADTFDGGDGVDRVVYQNSAVAVHVSLAGAVGVGGDAEGDVLTGIENLNGSNYDDYLIGNDDANYIVDINGNDTLDGGAGADTLWGLGGNDIYYVDNIGDVVFEEAPIFSTQGVELTNTGTDTIRASIDITALAANVENLELLGSVTTGNGNALKNHITGNAADNSIDGRAGADTMAGGQGGDTYFVDNAGDVVIEALNAGVDTVQASVNRTLEANVENLVLTGAEDFSGAGNNLANTITGNDGANTLDGLTGADTLIGGLGNDIYYIDNAGDVVTENASEGADTIRSTIGIAALAGNVEDLEMLGSAALATGNGLANHITGNGANNTIDGKAGADTMLGGAGNDTYYVDDLGDVVTETASNGADSVFSTVTFSLGVNVENLTLQGAALNATGNALNNALTGDAQKNVLNGASGEDTLAGGLDSDTYVYNSVGDVITEAVNAGLADTVVAYIDLAALMANVENLQLAGTAVSAAGNGLNNTLIGNSLANVLTGGDGNDQLNGGVGADTLTGGLGDDSYLVENSGDVAIENNGEGYDTLYAFVSIASLAANVEKLTLMPAGGVIDGTANDLDNRLNGNDSANVLTALGGNDVINGLGGADHIIGGAGLDNITGGAGNDVFVYQSVSDSGLTGATRDLINDFAQGADIIDLSAIDAITGGGDDAFTLIGASAFTHTAGELRYNLIDAAGAANDFTLISMDVDGDGAADSQITLKGLVSLAATDFVL